MIQPTFDECRQRANTAVSTLEGYSSSKEDRDWYDRGHNYCLLKIFTKCVVVK